MEFVNGFAGKKKPQITRITQMTIKNQETNE
jgi:hypothetical protein